MNAKKLMSAVLLAGLLWRCAPAHAQESPAPPGIEPPPIRKETPSSAEVLPPGAVPVAAQPSPSGLSDWITGKCDNCSTPGANVPLYTEWYVRSGTSTPVGGNYLDRELQTGWTIEGGVRGMLFNSTVTGAWLLDAHIVNSNNSGISNGDPRTLSIFVPNAAGSATLTNVPVTIRDSNRTLVGLGVGKEWFLLRAANEPGCHWRVGVDGGPRYGTEDMEFNEIRHRTDTLGGLYSAVHTDIEIPYGRWFFSCGLRCEWAYTWSDNILQRKTDVQEIMTLINFSVRY